MSTSLEQAISALLCHDQPLTVVNVLNAYLHATGFIASDATQATVGHEAVIAFEHALDKQPLYAQSAGEAFRQRLYTAEVTRLRREYWQERLGAGAVSRCTCPTCGKTVAYAKEVEKEIEGARARTRDGKRKSKKKSAVRRLSESSDGSVTLDPYGPSTSAYIL
ncbi:hypothetical protein B0H21DRAFT_690334 [Amylocystis lapponica]|nr:hypothetical protein B0H21DRAFT_690334 [Amylocystis lapponica]